MADISGLLGRMDPNLNTETKKAGAGYFDEFGILSPSEKLQQQMAAQQSQQASFALQQQLAAGAQSMQLASAGAKANAPTGFNFSQFLASGGMGNIQQADKLANQVTQAQRGAPPIGVGLPDTSNGIDPRQIILDSLAKFPDRGQALKVAGAQIAALGKATNNADLQNVAANLLLKSQSFEKDQAEIDAKKASTSKDAQETTLAKAKAGRPGEWQNIRDAQGNMNLIRQKVDAEGNYTGDEVKAGGPNKQITEDQSGLTNTQVGANVDKFTTLTSAAEQAAGTMSRIDKLLESGAGQGWVSKGAGFMSNLTGTLQQMGTAATLDNTAMQALADKKGTFQKWFEKTGISQSNWQDLVSSLAKTYNPTGTITEKDIARAAEAVGAGMTNVGAVRGVLKEAKTRMFREVNTQYNNAIPKVQDYIKPVYDKWKQRVKAPVFVQSPDEARKLSPGTSFVTPDGEELTR